MKIAEVNLETFLEKLTFMQRLIVARDPSATMVLEYIQPNCKLKLRIGDDDNRILVTVYYGADFYNSQPEKEISLKIMWHMINLLKDDIKSDELRVKTCWIKHRGEVWFYVKRNGEN